MHCLLLNCNVEILTQRGQRITDAVPASAADRATRGEDGQGGVNFYVVPEAQPESDG